MQAVAADRSSGQGPMGLIFDLQRFSIHDGRGIRTLVFLKGCPLRCLWCCNPESQSSRPELMIYPDRCIGCGECLRACPQGAAVVDHAGHPATDRSRCRGCGSCVGAGTPPKGGCPSNARLLRGRTVSVAEVLREVEKDRAFYRTSGGGVTVSGGEPLLQPEFTAELLRACRRRGLDTAVETCGHAPWDGFARVLPHANAVLFDLKHLDPAAHRRLTGTDNELILANLRRVAASGVPVTVRVPLVPGCNDDVAHLRAVADFLRSLGLVELHLLPYHRLGEAKYRALGRSYPLNGLEQPSDADVLGRRQILETSGLKVVVGG